MAIIRKTLQPVILCTALCLGAGLALADIWPPPDPNEGTAAVEITTLWAQGLRKAQGLTDVQRAAGTGGKMEGIETRGSTSRAVFTWTGRDGKGRIRVFDYNSGGFAAIIDPADYSGKIVLNSFGAFDCRHCAPPVNACGRRPSWIPHDVHWDTYDCPRTITGPQDMPGGG